MSPERAQLTWNVGHPLLKDDNDEVIGVGYDELFRLGAYPQNFQIVSFLELHQSAWDIG